MFKKSELYNISPRPRLYDLRHAAVSRIILKWLKEGISSIVILYRLKIHLGHKNFEDTINTHLHSHLLRHSRSQHWYDVGINIEEISLLLGHSQLTTSLTYTFFTVNRKKRLLKKNWEAMKHFSLLRLQ